MSKISVMVDCADVFLDVLSGLYPNVRSIFVLSYFLA